MLKSVSNFMDSDSKKHEVNFAANHYKESDLVKKSGFAESPIGLFFGGIVVWFLDSVQVILIAFAIFIVFHLFIASPHTIEGPSMEPNFCEGDLVLADKISPRFQGYQFEDVIIFKHDAENDYIKRIIGLPGDKIKIEDKKVYRNGELLKESYLPQDRPTDIFAGSRMVEGVEYTVPENKYLVLGDNREKSVDSRSFLFIDPEINTIKGKITALIWPVNDARMFDKHELKPVDNCKV